MNPQYIKIIIYLSLFLFSPLTISAEEVSRDTINKKLTSLNNTIAKAIDITNHSETQIAKELLNKAIQLRNNIESQAQKGFYTQTISDNISKASSLAKKSINLVIVRELIPKELARIKETLNKFKIEIDQSNNKNAQSLYQKACQNQSLAYSSYQETEYSLSLKYLKEASILTKKLINILKAEEYAQKRLNQVINTLKSSYKEVLASKNKGAYYYIKKAIYLSKEASSLIKTKKYDESFEIIEEIKSCINKAKIFAKGNKTSHFDSQEILKDLKYLEAIYAKAEAENMTFQNFRITKIFQQAETLKKNIHLKINEKLFEEAYENLYQCHYLVLKSLHLLKKESIISTSTDDKIKNCHNNIFATETLVRESKEEEAFILLWQAKELHTKAKINLARGKNSEALEDLERIPVLISKAAYIAKTSIRLTKKLNWRISHLEKLIHKTEDYLKEELDKEIAKEIKNLLQNAKESRIRANIFLARREKEKALYNVNEGLKYAQKALSNINKSNLLNIEEEETTRLELIRLENLISKAEKKVNEISDDKAKNALVDAKKIELIALKFFQEKNYKKTLENIRVASNFAYKAMGIKDEENTKFNVLVTKINQLDKVLIKAQSINKENTSKEAKELLDKAIEIHKNALTSLYVIEDYNQAEKEVKEALKYSFLSIEKAKKGKEEDFESIAQKQLRQGRKIIEEAKNEIVSTKNKEARKVLNLSEKYFNMAFDCFKNKDFQKTITNLETSKSFAIKAIKLAQEQISK
ncbi:MAG: hypothetical protein QMD92_03785 [bacterium]|nr:hypothetical protein [bacterium]